MGSVGKQVPRFQEAAALSDDGHKVVRADGGEELDQLIAAAPGSAEEVASGVRVGWPTPWRLALLAFVIVSLALLSAMRASRAPATTLRDGPASKVVAPELVPELAPEVELELAQEREPEYAPEQAPQVAPDPDPELASERAAEQAPQVTPMRDPELATERGTEPAAPAPQGAGIFSGKVTLVLMTHSGSRRLKQFVRVVGRYNAMPQLVAKTIVVLNNISRSVPALSGLSSLERVQVVEFARNSMNNRFAVVDHVDTEAVVVLDDDLFLTPSLVLCLISRFEENPDRLLSLDVRYTQKDRYIGSGVNASKPKAGTTGLGRTMMFARHFLLDYMSHDEMVRWVDTPHFCEDLLMSALIANETGRGPLFVRQDATHLREELPAPAGLSSRSAWYRGRHECVRWANAYFGNPYKVSQQVVGCGGRPVPSRPMKIRISHLL